MSVENIILGLLEHPSTGYRIKQDFDEVFNNFWFAEQSQIYRALKSLEERGLVRSRMEPPEKGPARRVYRRTASGRRAVLTWLADEPQVGSLRVPYLAQLFFLNQLNDWGHTEVLVQRVQAHFEARLGLLQGLDRQWHEAVDSNTVSAEDFHPHFVLTHGIARARAVVEWARETLDRIAARPGADRDDPRAGEGSAG